MEEEIKPDLQKKKLESVYQIFKYFLKYCITTLSFLISIKNMEDRKQVTLNFEKEDSLKIIFTNFLVGKYEIYLKQQDNKIFNFFYVLKNITQSFFDTCTDAITRFYEQALDILINSNLASFSNIISNNVNGDVRNIINNSESINKFNELFCNKYPSELIKQNNDIVKFYFLFVFLIKYRFSYFTQIIDIKKIIRTNLGKYEGEKPNTTYNFYNLIHYYWNVEYESIETTLDELGIETCKIARKYILETIVNTNLHFLSFNNDNDLIRAKNKLEEKKTRYFKMFSNQLSIEILENIINRLIPNQEINIETNYGAYNFLPEDTEIERTGFASDVTKMSKKMNKKQFYSEPKHYAKYSASPKKEQSKWHYHNDRIDSSSDEDD